MTEIGYDVERGFDVDFHGRLNTGVFCAFCETEGSRSPSCSVNVNGYWKCHSCERKGHVVAFYAQYKGISRAQARFELMTSDPSKTKASRGRTVYADDGTKIKITDALVKQTKDNLASDGRWLCYLRSRGIGSLTIEKHNIGCDEQRITIPIYRDGDPINFRRYLPGGRPKFVSHLCGDGTPQLYPESTLDEYLPGEPLIVCEGEWDCLLLNQVGIQAVTGTGGCGYWNDEWSLRLASLPRIKLGFLYDVHDRFDQGQIAATTRVAEMRVKYGVDARNIVLDLDNTYIGGDVTDYLIRARRSIPQLKALVRGALN